MAKPDAVAEALKRATSVAQLRQAQIIYSSELTRSDREILFATGWLQEITRGWYMLVRPDVATGDTAAWYANFWDFVRIYLQHRFDNNYCLATESSLDLHTENPIVPKQVIVIAKQGAGLRTLMHDTSLLIYTDPKNFPQEISQLQGINVMPLEYALCKISPMYFKNNPRDAEIALRSVKSATDLSRILIRYNLKSAAARLMGAYQFLNDQVKATQIKNDLMTVGVLVTPTNPFEHAVPLLAHNRIKSPSAARIQAMWQQAREDVLAHFPTPPGLPKESSTYIHRIEELYQFDAYNSLSIEGYQVTPELIDRVKTNQWDPMINPFDDNTRNALAAKGYYDAFQAVKSSITKIIAGEDATKIVNEQLQTWYQKLFGPAVQTGIIPQGALFGFRQSRVHIRNSRHLPPAAHAVGDSMETFFECLANEDHPGVRAVLGHYFFVFIHPYMDGNGRIARFLMNAMLASGGYPWTVIRVSNRQNYISILESTHREFDLTAFTQFVRREMKKPILSQWP